MAALHVEPNFNPEEAAHAAAEFVSSMLLSILQILYRMYRRELAHILGGTRARS
jgi:hypothetical protein